MPKRGLHVMYGAPDVGKSFVALNVALHVANKMDWAGCPIKSRGNRGVVYVAAEAGLSFRKRVLGARDARRSQ